MVALKTMLFFTGNSNDGSFRVAQKTIFDRMNISEKRYYEARKKLQEMGWIYYSGAENAIYVNYNKIYEDYREYLKKRNQAGGSDDSPNTFGIHDSPVVKKEADWSLDELTEYFDDSPSDSHQDRYNNIKNNISNTIKKNISSGAGCPGGQPPQESLIEKMNEEDSALHEWCKSELRRIDNLFHNPIESSELKVMYSSDEFQQYKKELEEKRNALRQKYGKLYKG